ncbi:MAG: hypothetical protein RLZZ577_1209 [Bacteroidota bacterium]|jgi:hypothetical protein
MGTALYVLLAILLEVLLRIVPTKFDISIISNVKNIALAIHNLIDILLPNVKKEG